MYAIENDFLRVSVRSFGAELTSVFDKKTKTEHLWQADEKYWGWHAPVLFPVVGRCWNDTITIDGQNYHMEKHGFARKSEFIVVYQTDDSLLFSLQYSDKTLAIYPYRFEFQISYKLKVNKVEISYSVINLDEKDFFFSIGGHPALAVPFHEGEKYEDYFIEFENDKQLDRHFIDDDGFFNGKTGAVLENSFQLKLKNDLFEKDALIFKNLKSRKVFIRSAKHNKYVVVEFEDFHYLGLWAKVNAPYVCIEPWLGCADTAGLSQDFSQKEEVLQLEKNGIFTASYSIGIY